MVGMTRADPPAAGAAAGQGYACDHSRVRVGSGEADFETAKAALRSWGCGRCQRPPFVLTPVRQSLPARLGLGGPVDSGEAGRERFAPAPCWLSSSAHPYAAPVCVCAQTLLLWSRNPLQVVFTEESRQTRDVRKRFAFAHGTLAGHMLVRAAGRISARLRRPGGRGAIRGGAGERRRRLLRYLGNVQAGQPAGAVGVPGRARAAAALRAGFDGGRVPSHRQLPSKVLIPACVIRMSRRRSRRLV